MKKIVFCLMCVFALSFTGCSLLTTDESTPEVNFGWAEEGNDQAIQGYTCIGSTAVYVDAFQDTFEAIAQHTSFTTAGGYVYLSTMNSRKVDKYVKKYADKAIALSESNCKKAGYDLPSGETFRVVYSYGASKKKTKVLNYPVK